MGAPPGPRRFGAFAGLVLLLLVGGCSSADETSPVLAIKSISLTGYAPPSTTSSAAVMLSPEHQVDFVTPASGWVRIRFSGTAWVSAPGVKENWSVLVGDSERIFQSDMTVVGTTSPTFVSYELVTNMNGRSARFVPGDPVTLSWGWSVPETGRAGTAFFDNAVSTMTVEQVPAPAEPSTAPDALISRLTTPENVDTVGGSTAEQTAEWSATPDSGDLLLALFVADVDATAFAAPPGWELAGKARVGAAGTKRSGLFWKVAGPAEPTTVTFGGNGASVSALHLWSKRGFTGTPTVESTSGVTADAFTSGTTLRAGGVAHPPQYAVAWLASGDPTTIIRIGNGYSPVFDDSGESTTMGAVEKTLLVTGTPQVKPAITAPQLAGIGLVVFSGV